MKLLYCYMKYKEGTMENIVKAVVINDLHFGIADSQRLYNELHQFKDFIKGHKDIQLLVIDGDYFDKKLSMTDTAAYLAMMFFKEVYDICKDQHIIIRMVQGTRGHELNQLQMFDAYESNSDVDFHIIRTVQEEDILGLHVLYIPEEYPENEEEYYKQYKAPNKRYNVVFGHGTWDFVSFDSQIIHAQQTLTRSAPVFIWNEWKHTVPNGFITFGHIHGRNVYGKKIFYSGAFTRWGYGEKSERGFTYFEYNLDKQTYDVKFINNTEAPLYESVALTSINGIDMKNQDITMIKKTLDEYASKFDNLSVDLSGLSEENVSILKKAYACNPNIKLEIKTKPVTLNEESGVIDEKIQKYKYITKRTLPLPERIQKYCKEDMNQELPLETINKILTEES